MEVGNIVFLKNICFKEGVVDHAFDRGRPCIFIGELDEKMYFVPLASVKNLKYRDRLRGILKPNKNNNLTKICHTNVKELIEKPIAFYEIKGYLNDEELFNLFNDIKIYYSTIRNEKNRIMVMFADNYMKSFKKYVDYNKKIAKRK